MTTLTEAPAGHGRLADVYGPGEVVRDKVVPRSLLTTSASFCRPAHGIEPPNGVRVHLAGPDTTATPNGFHASRAVMPLTSDV
jgi:uncharacterized circularly permuted ATP-grasp superfamily protein